MHVDDGSLADTNARRYSMIQTQQTWVRLLKRAIEQQQADVIQQQVHVGVFSDAASMLLLFRLLLLFKFDALSTNQHVDLKSSNSATRSKP
jgi:hypothetical protein